MTRKSNSSKPDGGDLVVIGSSAGGIEALSILLDTLPADFQTPIVIAQHLDPSRPSGLADILRQHTSLTIQVVTGSLPIQPGTIYLVPSNRHVLITDHHVALQEERGTRPRPSVDLLLSTAATVFGDRLIAVILTGSGADGAAGAADVKQAGGIVIVQNPQTARYPSMPLALPPTIVDYEVDLEQIGPLLRDLVIGAGVPQPKEKTDDVLREILEQISRQASIDFRPYKTSTIVRRITRRMTAVRVSSMREYAHYLENHPAEVGELVNAFLINVTEFFRDAEAFTYLQNEILPALIERGRGQHRVLRLWSAGCATGEEAYSLAFLITNALGAELPEWSIKIFATDLDDAAISYARRGLYAENALKGLPQEYRERYFERVDHGYRISKQLRQMVIFGQQDLSRSAPFPRIDLVLCRNVLIYFTTELQDYVLNQFAFSLNPGGYLFLGKAETVRPTQAHYEVVSKTWKVYRCTGNPLPLARPVSGRGGNRPVEQRPWLLNRPERVSGNAMEPKAPSNSELASLRRFNELLLRSVPIGIAVIDRAYRLLTANSAMRRIVGLHDLSEEQDFLHAARGIPYELVRSAIDTAFRERRAATLPEVELTAAAGGPGRFVSITVTLMQVDPELQDLATITISDITEQVQTRQQLKTMQAEQAQLMNELNTTNKQLNDANKELLDANEELQVSNEELILTHEELQATIEEFETTNEELQATNEELETNNEELQATNEELQTTNEETRARTQELLELMSTLETEQARLRQIVELAPFYIMVLHGPDLLIQAINPRFGQLLEGWSVLGQPLDHVSDLFWPSGVAVADLAREAYREDQPVTTRRLRTRTVEASGQATERYVIYNLVPSHDPRGEVNGVIIYAADVTEQRVQELEREAERLRLIFDHAEHVIFALFDAGNAELITASSRYMAEVERANNLPAGGSIGRRWHDMAVFIPAEERESLWQEVTQDRHEVHFSELPYRFGPEAADMVWNWRMTPILSAETPDQSEYVLIVAVDMTEQARARQELERLDKQKDEFLSIASHELRSPLTAISGATQLLQRDLMSLARSRNQQDRPDEQRPAGLLQTILNQARRMSLLIDDFLDVTRINVGQFQLRILDPVDLVALVRRVVTEMETAFTDHPVTVQTEFEQLIFPFDEPRLEQVMNNLLSNAFKYSAAGKPVTVGVERQQSAAGTNEAVVWVRDEGQGIAPAQHPHIFERFHRIQTEANKHTKGMGLGLFISREIVRRHGGRMWFTSEQGVGSTFCLALPIIVREDVQA